MAISLLLMPQENQTVTPPKRQDKCPTINPFTGLCVVCGNKDSHAWSCIIYYISASVGFYQKSLTEAKALFEKLKVSNHVATHEIQTMIDKLQYVEDLKNNIKDDKQSGS